MAEDEDFIADRLGLSQDVDQHGHFARENRFGYVVLLRTRLLDQRRPPIHFLLEQKGEGEVVNSVTLSPSQSVGRHASTGTELFIHIPLGLYHT